jgi:hypothetical protein
MNDNEIIKAIEICAKNSVTRHNGLTYQGIPLHFLFEEILGFVNRQKAEIERLEAENNHFADIGKMYSEIKAEIVKEFAERIKGESGKCVVEQNGHEIYETKYYTINAITLDNLVKEFPEGKNDG